MDAIKELFQTDIASIVMGIFIIMSGIIAGYSILGKFSEIIGKPVKWVKQKNLDRNAIEENAKKIEDLSQKHEKDITELTNQEKDIREKIEHLTSMFIDKEINDYRWEIINFSTKVSEGKPCNRDSYKHCFRTYEKYEKLLEDNNLENGEVEISMSVIKDSYRQKLKNGFSGDTYVKK